MAAIRVSAPSSPPPKKNDISSTASSAFAVSGATGATAAAASPAIRAAPSASPMNSRTRLSTAATAARACGSRDGLVGLLQVLRRGGPGRERLGDAELEQDLDALLGRGRLLERAAQVGDGALRRPAADGVAARALEQLRGPGRAAAGREQELRGDLLDRRAGLAQHLCGALVLELSLRGRELVVDGVADERVHEAERRLGPDDLRADQLARGGGHRALVGARQGGDAREVRALAEHGGGPGDRAGVVRQAREPQQHGAGDGARADGPHDRGLVGAGLHALGLERAQELAQQQRVAAGRLVAGGAEAGVGVVAEPLAHERRRPPRRSAGRGAAGA